jgi:hypothetical protein
VAYSPLTFFFKIGCDRKIYNVFIYQFLMDNKDSYKPEQVADMMRVYQSFQLASINYIAKVIQGVEEFTPEKASRVKDLAITALRQTLEFERNVPDNVRCSFAQEMRDLEERIGDIINLNP